MAKLLATLIFSVLAFGTSATSNSFEFLQLFRISSTFTTSTACNEVLNTTSGTISYKTNQTLVSNERCVWTIRSPNATSYSFGIFEMGFPEPSSDHQITVAGVTRDSNIAQLVPTQPGIYNVENVNVLIVTFHTGPSASGKGLTGFSLQYIGTSNPAASPSISSQSTDIISTSRLISELGQLMYPDLPRWRFDNNELTTLVFSSYGNVYNKSNERGMLYSAQFGDSTCGDYTDLYYFNANTSPATWEFQAKLCDDDDGGFYMIPHKDMVLAVLQTNEVDVNFGLGFRRPGC